MDAALFVPFNCCSRWLEQQLTPSDGPWTSILLKKSNLEWDVYECFGVSSTRQRFLGKYSQTIIIKNIYLKPQVLSLARLFCFCYIYMKLKYKQDYKASLFTTADPFHDQEEDLIGEICYWECYQKIWLKQLIVLDYEREGLHSFGPWRLTKS